MVFAKLLQPRLKQTVLLALCLAVLPETSLANPSADARNPRRDPLLLEAQAAANRIVQRFHKSLDFKESFAAEFVTEPRLRARALAWGEPDPLDRFDTATRERAYVTSLTFLHLWAEYMMIQDVNDVPPEIDKEQEKPDWFLSSAKPPKDLQELNQGLIETERLSNLYRKYFSPEAFRAPVYLKNIKEEQKRIKIYRHNVPRVEKGNGKFAIPEDVPVYVVRPELFDYYFIREKGAMKLFYVNIMPNFRLF